VLANALENILEKYNLLILRVKEVKLLVSEFMLQVKIWLTTYSLKYTFQKLPGNVNVILVSCLLLNSSFLIYFR